MLTTAHSLTDSRIWAQEARSLRRLVGTVVLVGPDGNLPGDPDIEVRTFPRGRGFLRRLMAPIRLLQVAWRTPAHVYHCHELDAAFAAALIKLFRPCRVVFDSHELYREMIPLHFPQAMRPVVKAMIYLFEVGLYTSCDAVITVTGGVAARLARAVRPEKLTVIYNASGQQLFPTRPCAFRDKRRRIVHLGNLTFRRGARQICEAMGIVRKETPDAVLYLIGKCDSEAEAFIARFREEESMQETIVPLGYVPFAELGAYLPYVEVGIMGLESNQNTINALPVKMFDYMSFGIPTVASDLPEIRRLNEKHEVALLVDTLSAEGIAGGILRLLRDEPLRRRLGETGLQAVATEYSWEHMEKRLLSLYQQLLMR